MLINAYSKLRKKFPEYTLEIYGEGPLRKSFEEQISAMELQDSVLLPGYVNNIKEVLQEATMFVLLSNYEGMPNALMEALALGVPSISTDCPVGGPKYLIDDGINGFLIPINDEQTLVNRMEYILSNDSAINELSFEAMKIVQKLHPDKIYGAWEEVIHKTFNDYQLMIRNADIDNKK